MSSNGTFFVAQDSEQKFEIGYRNQSLFIIVPLMISKSQKKRLKRISINFDSIGHIGPILDLTVTFQYSHIHVYDQCDEIYSGFEANLDWSFFHPKIDVHRNWKGPELNDFSIGSGWPIGLKCRAVSIKKKYAESYSEEIEKEFQENPTQDLINIFYETVVIPPDNFDGCKIDNILLAVGETQTKDCNQCTCESRFATCEPPPCPEEDWVYNEKFNCCPKCRDFARFCAVNPCHKDAECTDLKRGPKCSCNTGFQGNGSYCEDIDECSFSKDAREQLGGCLAGSVCRNVPGSYKCDCLPGFQMIGEHTCLPLIRV
uniref:EGF-like domain-containing protein n=1 Tax=Caenorhabditis japonica TaxID=281687 RepID=A0A8R1DI07_CAEJA